MPTETYLEVGCRIPKDYFWVIGWGESDVGIETGSYDAALTMAGIENLRQSPPQALRRELNWIRQNSRANLITECAYHLLRTHASPFRLRSDPR